MESCNGLVLMGGPGVSANGNCSKTSPSFGCFSTTMASVGASGLSHPTTVTDPKQVAARRLVVYPEEVGDALRIHVAWEVEAGSGTTWTVYVDAVTGAAIATRQNFQT